MVKESLLTFIGTVKNKLKGNKDELISYLENAEFMVNNMSECVQIETYVPPYVSDFGFEVKHGKKKPKQIFLIPLKEMIELYWQNKKIRDKLKNNCNSKPIIKLALYHDEITIVNPIGNFCILNQRITFLHRFQQ